MLMGAARATCKGSLLMGAARAIVYYYFGTYMS